VTVKTERRKTANKSMMGFSGRRNIVPAVGKYRFEIRSWSGIRAADDCGRRM